MNGSGTEAANRATVKTLRDHRADATAVPFDVDGLDRYRRSTVLTAQRDSAQHLLVERVKGNRRLVVLPAGPRVPDPGELVASQRFGDILRELRSATVDLVIVDSPALMEVGDAAAMAAQIEALVMIVDLDMAHHSTLVEMRHLLAPLPCKKLGAILVKTKGRTSGYGYYD